MQTVIHRYPIKEPLLYEANLSCSPTITYIPTPDAQQEYILPQQDTGIVDSGATHLYISPSAPHGPPESRAAKISLGTANGQVENSSAKATLPIPQLEVDFHTMGYIMPYFTNRLVGVGPICDADCTVVFTKQDIPVLLPKGKAILTGFREKKLPRIWRFDLKPTEELIKNHTATRPTTLAAHSAFDLPIIEALVPYMHAAAGFPVKHTWLIVILKGNFATWHRLTYFNAAKYCPHAAETIHGKRVQSLQVLQYTKKKTHLSRGIKKEPAKFTLEKEYEREDIPPPPPQNKITPYLGSTNN